MLHKYMLLTYILFSCNFAVAESEDFKSKLSLRSGLESLVNKGELSGSQTNIGGFNIGYSLFLNSSLAIIFGYAASFDLGNAKQTVNSYILAGKYYFSGLGTTIEKKDELGTSISKSNKAYYVGSSYGLHDYFLGSDSLSIDAEVATIKGTYSTTNVFIGADYFLTKKLELNFEAGITILAFAASDNRVKIHHTWLLAGLNWVF